VPEFLDYEMWTVPAPLRPYDMIPHERWWRTFMEYGNGIMGDMCVHMLDTTRWMLGLGWPKSVSSTGGIFVEKNGKSNITDTQVATFQYPEFNVVWQHRTWGSAPDPKYPWALTLYGDRGTLKASPQSYDFIPEGRVRRSTRTASSSASSSRGRDRAEDRPAGAPPATRAHMKDFLAAVESRGKAAGRHRDRATISDRLVHPGQRLDATRRAGAQL
jgi:predicted dehydrogenase